MRLIVVAAHYRNLRQAQPIVRNETAGSLEPQQAGNQFWRNTDHLSETLTEMPPAITDFIRKLLNRHRPVAFRQSFPRPRDLTLWAEWVELRDKCSVENGEALVPGMGTKKRFYLSGKGVAAWTVAAPLQFRSEVNK